MLLEQAVRRSARHRVHVDPPSAGLLLAAAAAALLLSATSAAEPWRFGVMGDTQWGNASDAEANPGTVAVGIVRQVNQELLRHGAKLVVQVGDLVDREANYEGLPQTPRIGLATRAEAARALAAEGVAFFPVRGNHESSATAARELQRYFPQTRGGSGAFGATDFSSPSANLEGLSYAFDFESARFVLLDQFTPTDGRASDGSRYEVGDNAIASQRRWMDSTLQARPDGTHAFVFTHKQLIGARHTDTLFGRPNRNSADQDAFVGALEAGRVGYLFTGHDHLYNRSVVASPNGASFVTQLICASNSSKFYSPGTLASHGEDPESTGGPNAGKLSKGRERPLSQELFSIGYFLVTVDGPRVTVDFFSADPRPSTADLEDVDLRTTPRLTFARRETFGYSLNGRGFVIAPGGSYEVVRDDTSAAQASGATGFRGTHAAIVDGRHRGAKEDANARRLHRAVNTGWAPAEADLASDVLTLWGMEDLAAGRGDPFTLALSAAPGTSDAPAGPLPLAIARRDAQGRWEDAARSESGEAIPRVTGPWRPGLPLGASGFDPATRTAWAVLDRGGELALVAASRGALESPSPRR